jgi:hypothetical protein
MSSGVDENSTFPVATSKIKRDLFSVTRYRSRPVWDKEAAQIASAADFAAAARTDAAADDVEALVFCPPPPLFATLKDRIIAPEEAESR